MGGHTTKHAHVHVESLSGCKKLGDVKPLIAKLKEAENNEERISLVSTEKEGFLFSCEQIKAVCEVTPSVKTRIAFIEVCMSMRDAV